MHLTFGPIKFNVSLVSDSDFNKLAFAITKTPDEIDGFVNYREHEIFVRDSLNDDSLAMSALKLSLEIMAWEGGMDALDGIAVDSCSQVLMHVLNNRLLQFLRENESVLRDLKVFKVS